ncbi:MAG: aldose epimerase family protein [Polyangiaceae bacterium]|jgi:aldose 1-epimerase
MTDHALNAKETKPVQVVESAFGTADGREVSLYTLTNESGLILKVTNYGAIVTEFHVPDRTGHLGDVVAGHDKLDGYVNGIAYLGAIVGRVGNRIHHGTFELAGKRYRLAINDPPHHLHGGNKGWDKVVWTAEPLRDGANGPAMKFTHVSEDGEEGYPGTVMASVTYTLTNENELKVEMQATTDRTTIVNMAQHTYWNLAGFDSGPVLDHELTLHADAYTPGAPIVPDGTIESVEKTPFDFTIPKAIGKDLRSVVPAGNPARAGYDHNFVVSGNRRALRPVARVKSPRSGRVMTIDSNQPGVQFYAAIFLDGSITGKGHTYRQYDAFCLETQKFPNSINVPAWRDEVILEAGETDRHVMVHRFSTDSV